MPSLAAEVVDGRQSRTARSRRAICDACLDLIGEGVLQPSADEVAQRAGVSRRSIFNHFADLAELYDAVLEVGIERAAPLLDEVPKVGALEERIGAFIGVRARFLEDCTPYTRALTAQALVGSISEEAIRISRKGLEINRRMLEEMLAEDLSSLRAAERRELLEALTSAMAPLTWEHMRGGRDLSVARATAVMRRSVMALLRDAGLDV